MKADSDISPSPETIDTKEDTKEEDVKEDVKEDESTVAPEILYKVQYKDYSGNLKGTKIFKEPYKLKKAAYDDGQIPIIEIRKSLLNIYQSNSNLRQYIRSQSIILSSTRRVKLPEEAEVVEVAEEVKAIDHMTASIATHSKATSKKMKAARGRKRNSTSVRCLRNNSSSTRNSS